jgi:hypothetical protein
MNKFVSHVLEGEFFARCPDVPIFVPVSSQVSVDGCDENIATDVEFALID